MDVHVEWAPERKYFQYLLQFQFLIHIFVTFLSNACKSPKSSVMEKLASNVYFFITWKGQIIYFEVK